MSRFRQEFALVPNGARWTAVVVCLMAAALMASLVLVPGFMESDPKAVAMLLPLFGASLFGVAFLGAFILLVGYVFADARRRGMNHVLWTLIAIFVPNGIGLILYFILRDPRPVPCGSCGALVVKQHAFCPGCGAPARAACPQCRQVVEPAWRNCGRCGAPLAPRPAAAASSAEVAERIGS
jgi:RNA polymerase subunit RPABC4/transcription elongation factor Spt4